MLLILFWGKVSTYLILYHFITWTSLLLDIRSRGKQKFHSIWCIPWLQMTVYNFMMTSPNGHFPRYWPFVRGIHRWPVNSPHKGQRRGALMFSWICTWIKGWVNNREAGDLRHHRAHFFTYWLRTCPAINRKWAKWWRNSFCVGNTRLLHRFSSWSPILQTQKYKFIIRWICCENVYVYTFDLYHSITWTPWLLGSRSHERQKIHSVWFMPWLLLTPWNLVSRTLCRRTTYQFFKLTFKHFRHTRNVIYTKHNV